MKEMYFNRFGENDDEGECFVFLFINCNMLYSLLNKIFFVYIFDGIDF